MTRPHLTCRCARRDVDLMLVFALPSAHASAPPTPISGFADVHVHQFANLGFGGLVLWGQSFTPDNSIETALPWDDWTPGHFGDVVDKNGNPVGMTSCPNPSSRASA